MQTGPMTAGGGRPTDVFTSPIFHFFDCPIKNQARDWWVECPCGAGIFVGRASLWGGRLCEAGVSPDNKSYNTGNCLILWR